VRTKRVVAALLIVVALAACGRASGAPGGTGPGPETPVPTAPTHGFDVLITDQDRAVTVHAGQKVEVFLRQKSGMTPWSSISSEDTTVLAPVPTGITAVRGITIGGFVAMNAGTANLHSYAGPLCSPGQACPMYAILFSVAVTVVPSR
jgi:hypothetical protein